MRNSFVISLIPLALWGVTNVHCTDGNTTIPANNSTGMLAAASSHSYAQYIAPPTSSGDQQEQHQQQQFTYPSNIIRNRHMYSYEERPRKFDDNSKLVYEETPKTKFRDARQLKNKYDHNAVSNADNYYDNQLAVNNKKYFSPSLPSQHAYYDGKEAASVDEQQNYAQDNQQNLAVGGEHAARQRPAGYEIVTTIVNEDLGLTHRPPTPKHRDEPLQYAPERPQYLPKPKSAPSTNEIGHDSYKLPSCARNPHSTFCLRDYYYPHKKIQHAIETNRNGFLKLFAEAAPEEEPHQFFKKDKRSNKQQNSPYFAPLCNAHVAEHAKLKRARNTQGQWQIIVQARGYEQSVRLEQCKGYKNDCCNYVDAVRFDSQCVQKKSLQRLVIYDPSLYSNKYDLPFRVDIFSLPSCCSCQIDPYTSSKKQRKCGEHDTKQENIQPIRQKPEIAAPDLPAPAQPAEVPVQQQPQHLDVKPVVIEGKDKRQIVLDFGYATPDQQQVQQQIQQLQQQDAQQPQQDQLLLPPGPPPAAKFASEEPPVPLTAAAQATLPEQPTADALDQQQQQVQRRMQLPMTDKYNDGLESNDGNGGY